MEIGRTAGELAGAIRRVVIEPAEGAIATIERIATQKYPPEVAQYVSDQIGELARGIEQKLSDRSYTIKRLGDGLLAFEKRLFAMGQAGR